jgi:hypothetical protein
LMFVFNFPGSWGCNLMRTYINVFRIKFIGL